MPVDSEPCILFSDLCEEIDGRLADVVTEQSGAMSVVTAKKSATAPLVTTHSETVESAKVDIYNPLLRVITTMFQVQLARSI